MRKRTMSDKTAHGPSAPRTGTQTVVTEMEQVAVDEAQSLARNVAWRVLLAVAALIAHEAAIFTWKRMTGKPPPTRRRRARDL